MKNEPFIFLFTFVFNDRKHINKLFESIGNQTSSNFVYYLYDDCSNDTYDDLFKNLKCLLKNKGVKSYYEKGAKNLGINKSTEYCISVLKNKFKECTHFMWINSDDWLEKDAIEKFTNVINAKPNYAIYMSNLTKHFENKNLKKYNKNIFSKSKNYIIDSLYTEQIYHHFLVDKLLFFAMNPNGLIYSDMNYKNFFNDIAILFLASAFNLKTYFIKRNLTNFLIREDGASTPSLYAHRNKIDFFIPQHKYISQIDSNYLPTYNKIVRIAFTHIVCSNLISNKQFKKAKIYFRKNKKIYNKLKLQKVYLYPCKSSRILFYFPHLYYILNFIHKNIKI